MKWIFTILVALNLIVFGSMVAQKMLRTHSNANTDAARTIVIQTPPPAAPVAATPPPEAAAKPPRPKQRESRPAPAPRVAALPPAEPRRCGGATVVLKENDYHRIKGLLAQWPNAASRSVERNPNAATAPASDFWVIAPAQNDSNEQMMSLVTKGFRPTQENGLVVLGKFPARPAADALRQKAVTAGVAANVMEKIREGGQSLSVATYTVAFLNVNDADARKLSEILKPYASLRRNPCKK